MTKIVEKKFDGQSFEIYQYSTVSDSYCYILVEGSDAIVVDPCDNVVINEALKKLKLELKLILVTHARSDHIKGLESLKKEYGCQVMASSRSDLEELDQDVQNGEEYCIGSFSFKTICTAGDTNDHTCYYFQNLDFLFTGDTLYLLGCAKINEKHASEFLESFDMIGQLHPETMIFCGHDFLKRNMAFAEYVDGSNSDLQEFTSHRPSYASLKTLKKVNPFLRLDNKSLRKKVQQTEKIDVLKALIALRRDFSEE